VKSCRNIEEIHKFLCTCRYVSDQEQFGVKDHWMAPEDFERVRKGDCDDHALWTWRQLVDLGYNARYVVGWSGRYGAGHAWVTYERDGDLFVVEPLAARAGRTFPRLSVLRYKPSISVEVCGKCVRFYEHGKAAMNPTFQAVVPLVPEWLAFRARWVLAWLRWPFRIQAEPRR
jgi:hypothetical protein